MHERMMRNRRKRHRMAVQRCLQEVLFCVAWTCLMFHVTMNLAYADKGGLLYDGLKFYCLVILCSSVAFFICETVKTVKAAWKEMGR